MRNRGKRTDVPFVVPALRTHCSLRSPRGLVWGHTTRRPRLDTCSFRWFPARRPPAGKGQKNNTGPSALPTSVPLDPDCPVLGDHQSANPPRPRCGTRPCAVKPERDAAGGNSQ